MVIQFDRAAGAQNLNTNNNLSSQAKAQNKENIPAGAHSPQQADSVSLSQSARALQALGQQNDQFDEVDQAKVAQLRQSISDGSYQVDSQRVANKMIEFDNLF